MLVMPFFWAVEYVVIRCRGLRLRCGFYDVVCIVLNGKFSRISFYWPQTTLGDGRAAIEVQCLLECVVQSISLSRPRQNTYQTPFPFSVIC